MARLGLFMHPPKILNDHLNLVSHSTKEQCLSFLNSCSSMKQLFQIHAQICVSGLHRYAHFLDEIIRFCALHPLGNLSYGRVVVESSDNSASSSWNNLIRAYASDSPTEAIWVFLLMRRKGARPNGHTYPFLFKSCATVAALDVGRQTQGDVIKQGLDSNIYVQNTLIHLYGCCMKILDACKVFDEMLLRTIVSWNSILSACVENSRFYDSIELFTEMRILGFQPDETTMVILLSSSAELGSFSLGKRVHSQFIVNGLTMNCQLGTALVDMYAKCGSVEYAGLVFRGMTQRNVWTWSAMIHGLAQHGFAKEALELFTEMKNSSVKPNYVTFLGVLCACSHAGLVEEGHQFFHDMEHIHRIKPMLVHYGAMVNVLGRAGRLKEAYDFIVSMPFCADPTIWRALLSACNIHDVNDYDGVGHKVKLRLFELEPRRSENFVMVANKYAEVGMWEIAASLRSSMKDRGLKKIAGESCIEVDGYFHRFFCGDGRRVACDGVFPLLDGLNLHLKKINYE